MRALRSRLIGKFAGQTTLLNPEGYSLLSPRESDVLSYAASGMIDKEIGVELGITLNTLRSYWSRIRAKVGDAPRAAIAAGFVERNMLAEAESYRAVSLQEDWILDLETDLLTASDSINDRHGLPRGVSHPRTSYGLHYHPDDEAQVREIYRRALTGTDDAYHMTFRLVFPSGIDNVSLLILVERNAEGKGIKWHGHRLRTFNCRADKG